MIAVNTLIRWKKTDEVEKIERILWIDRKQDIAYVIDIFLNNSPFSRCVSEIEGAISEYTALLYEDDPFTKIIHEEDISELAKERRDKAWQIICELIAQEPMIFVPKARKELIMKYAKFHNVHEKTVYKYLKNYWIRGKTINALLPDYYRCGGPGKEKSSGAAKRGRKRMNKELLGEGINVDEEIKQVFRAAINKFYNTKAQNSLKLAYELMRKEFFVSDYKTENGILIPIIKPDNEVPTYAQFKYWFEKERNIKKEITLRKSAKKYEQQNRAIIGNSTVEALGPGSIYQIDATVGDIYLVSRFNRNWIIGRPVIYVAIDVFSRAIAGLYIGLEGPSWIGAMMALENTASNKVEFCKRFDIEIEENQWPVHHLPEAILADRGELEGKNIENLINGLHIKIQNTPPYRADWKGIVEQHFKITNTRVKPFLPGTIDSNVRERGDKDYRLDAKLDIFQFTQIMIKCALYHNNHHYLKNYCREEMMINDDVKCIPRELWNWGIENRSGKLRQVSEEIVKLNLMPTATATVTGKGIKFKNLYYGSSITLKERWFEKARNKGSWRVNVCYDPRNLDYIYIRNPNEMDFDKCYLLEYQSGYQDKSYEEIEYLIEKEKIDAKIASEKDLQNKIELITEIEHIVKESDKQLKMNKKTEESDRKRLGGIRKNRKIERMLNRESETFELKQEKVNINSQVIDLEIKEKKSNAVNDLELLRKKQKEALSKIHE
ncbi:Mu transposase C-terminal domain-containing protein [Clostridium formicaceticum]|uniref:DNA-binding protein n=1 Tax=Clostridium formicaceticum TaxID=1497 RepID=A0AAC9RNU5_9CLOT|nr:Mu transposase C-terminal domain-containing protein [Clostridium formicaceticum]AOY74998.1 DNA-binding protein [Clostridium formicaceticum]ARE89411.1 Transposon Tn7 transposition protein TnsB [Clostridium formicaceticum]